MNPEVKQRDKTCRIGFKLSQKLLANKTLARLYRRLRLLVTAPNSPPKARMKRRPNLLLPTKPAHRPSIRETLCPQSGDGLLSLPLSNGLPALARTPFLAFSSRSITAATMIGNPTVASTKTSPNFPPSDWRYELAPRDRLAVRTARQIRPNKLAPDKFSSHSDSA